MLWSKPFISIQILMDITHLKNYLKLEWSEYISWLYFSAIWCSYWDLQKLSYFWQLCYQKFSRVWSTCVKYYWCFTLVTEIYCTSFPARYFRSWNRPTNKENLEAKPQILEVCLDSLIMSSGGLMKPSRIHGLEKSKETAGWEAGLLSWDKKEHDLDVTA